MNETLERTFSCLVVIITFFCVCSIEYIMAHSLSLYYIVVVFCDLRSIFFCHFEQQHWELIMVVVSV